MCPSHYTHTHAHTRPLARARTQGVCNGYRRDGWRKCAAVTFCRTLIYISINILLPTRDSPCTHPPHSAILLTPLTAFRCQPEPRLNMRRNLLFVDITLSNSRAPLIPRLIPRQIPPLIPRLIRATGSGITTRHTEHAGRSYTRTMRSSASVAAMRAGEVLSPRYFVALTQGTSRGVALVRVRGTSRVGCG